VTPRRAPASTGIPGWVLVVAALGALFVLLPVVAMVTRVDWTHFVALITSPSSVDALLLSLRTSVAATAGCLVLGIPMAVVLARVPFRGRGLVRAIVLLPLVLPPVVGGIALVVIAQTFVALPFLVLSLEGALRTTGERYEAVAATLGARPSAVLFRVTLPLVTPAIVSGSILSFARALGEFGATLTFAGSLQGTTRTLPLEIYLQRETDPDTAVALSLVLIAVAIAVVAVAHGAGEPLRRRPRPGTAPRGASRPAAGATP
jgi:molybdate transport system permease protein